MALVFIKKVDGKKNKYRLPASEELNITIGRNEDCVISLPDVVGLSGAHCVIRYKTGSYYIKDDDSMNGTVRDDTYIKKEEPLQENTEYKIGEAILTFEAEGATVPPLPVPKPATSKESSEGEAKPLLRRRSQQGAASELAASVMKRTSPSAAASGSSDSNALYAFVILVASLIAGITLRHWKDTGQLIFTEMFTPAVQEAPATPAATTPPASTSPAVAAPASSSSDGAKTLLGSPK